jgi:predicted 3-demethylubiquinone-9 3-methyltransferase (glyoxalase superfamily)
MKLRGFRLNRTITPCILCGGKAIDAARYYTAIFPGGKILSQSEITATFELKGQKFMTLHFPKPKHTIGVSFMVLCKDQKEIDLLWKRLSAGGKILQCGWLQDKFGVAWQIVPEILEKLFRDRDEEKANRAFQAMMTMRKFDIAKLKAAHAGR